MAEPYLITIYKLGKDGHEAFSGYERTLSYFVGALNKRRRNERPNGVPIPWEDGIVSVHVQTHGNPTVIEAAKTFGWSYR